MPSFQQNIETIAAIRQSDAVKKADLYAAKIKLQKEEGKLSATVLEEKLSNQLLAEKNSRAALQNAIAELYVDQSPQTLLPNWKAKIPVLLMPLRLETRFMDGDDGKLELWLRIYPDDIAVQQHEPLLTQREFSEGQKYWKQFFLAEHDEGEKEIQKKAAWDNLKNQFGINRSVWIARQTLPENWSDRESLIDVENLLFKELELLKSDHWTQAPFTQALPDKFVVSIYNGSKKVHEQVGNLIPDMLYLGQDPFQADAAFIKNENGIAFADSFSWMSDFEKAIAVGMGMKIKLKNQYFRDHSKKVLDKIVVLGTYVSADADASAEVLGNLLESHRYSDGLAIVKQGTPTNNTESATSSFIANEDPQPKGYFEISDNQTFEQNSGCDAHRLSNALGVHSKVWKGVANDDSRDHAEAVKMNEALYPATVGYYFDTLLDQYVPDRYLPLIRDFFENYVTGAGALPAIRIGDQPYGILPTSNFSQWKPILENPEKAEFYTKLHSVLSYFHQQWETMSQKILYMGREKDSQNNPLNPEDVFLDVVGLQASSVSFDRPSGLQRDLPEFQTAWQHLAKFRQEADVNEGLILAQFRNFAGTRLIPPTLLQKLLFKKENKVHIPQKNLIDGLPLSESRLLQEIETVGKNYLEWLSEVGMVKTLEEHGLNGKQAPNFLLYLLARHAILLELRRAAIDFMKKKNGRMERSIFDKTYLNFSPPVFGKPLRNRDLTIWEILHADLNLIDGSLAHPRTPTLGDYLLKNQTDTTIADVPKVKKALAALSQLPTARLERLLTGHIDCLTYRLDAWQTGLFYERLESRRQDTTAPVTGIYLGAFGYLENLQPAAKTPLTNAQLPLGLQTEDGSIVYQTADNAGLLHAPSLDHAAAAAVLMAGYRNHATPQEPSAFAVNLSSARLRKATQVLEGIRNGQQLEAMLGYQFERACHDRTLAGQNLNQFVLAFRQAYLIENQYNPQEGEINSGEIFKQAPVHVVNGLKLSEERNENTIRIILQSAVPSLSQVQINAFARLIMEEIDQLSNTLDALKDLLLSESVFQVASGNIARTSAVLEALREGDIPPDPGILKTPRKSQFAFTNLVTVHFPQAPSNENPWNTVPLTPRARFESGLNTWLATYLGNPATISCQVSHQKNEELESPSSNITLEMLGLPAMDFVHFAGNNMAKGETELEQRIVQVYREKFNLTDELKINIHFEKTGNQAGGRSFAEVLPLAKSLNAVLSSARPAHAQDYAPFVSGQFSNHENPRGYDVSELLGRTNQLIAELENVFISLGNIIPNDSLPKNESNPATLNLLFQQWAQKNFSDNFFTGFLLSTAAIDNIIDLRISLANFDQSGVWPTENKIHTEAILTGTARAWRATDLLIAQAKSILTASTEARSIEEQVNMLVGLAKLLLGGHFPVMPKFRYHNSNDILASASDQTQLLKYYANLSNLPPELIPEDWLQSVAAVRLGAGKWELARSLAELHSGQDIPVLPLQLPYRPKDSWLAVQFPEFNETTGKPFGINTDTVSAVVFGAAAFETQTLQSALLIDEWSESIPVDTETSGVAFNYNQPDSMPPQSLLLAICPSDQEHWTWDDLLETVLDTFNRAKMRAVEPRHFADNQLLNNFLPGIVAPVNVKGNNIALDFAVASDEFLKKLPRNLSLYESFLLERP